MAARVGKVSEGNSGTSLLSDNCQTMSSNSKNRVPWGLTFQALTWKGIPPRRVCPGPGWPLGPRGRESAPQLPEAEPCQSNQYLIYLKVSCNRCPFKCPPFHCEQPRQRKEEEGRGKNGLGAFYNHFCIIYSTFNLEGGCMNFGNLICFERHLGLLHALYQIL